MIRNLCVLMLFVILPMKHFAQDNVKSYVCFEGSKCYEILTACDMMDMGGVDSFKFSIYSRWGVLFYESSDKFCQTGFDPGEKIGKESKQTYKYAEEVYVYMLKSWSNGNEKKYSGTFTIVR